MTNATPQELLLSALLSMDVYHRDVVGGLIDLVKSVDNANGALDDVTPLETSRLQLSESIGFFAKAYEANGKIYIAYRGTDDGSLAPENIASSVFNGTFGADGPLKDLYYGYPLAIGSLGNLGQVTGGFSYKSEAIEAIRFYKQIRERVAGRLG